MAQVRYVDRLLYATSQRAAAAEQAEGTRSEHLVQVMEHEVAAHEQAVALHEVAAELQEEGGWRSGRQPPRPMPPMLGELARRSREELARYKARAAAAQEQVAAQERVEEVQKRRPSGWAVSAVPGGRVSRTCPKGEARRDDLASLASRRRRPRRSQAYVAGSAGSGGLVPAGFRPSNAARVAPQAACSAYASRMRPRARAANRRA